MKLTALFLLLLPQMVQSQQSNDDIFMQLLKYEQNLMDGVATGDRALWIKNLHDSCIITIENGEAITKQKMIEKLNPLPVGYHGRIVIIEPRYKVYGNTAVISFINDEYLELFSQKIHTQYRQTDTWMKINEEWKIIAMQVFEIPKNPPPTALLNPNYKQFTGTYQLSPENKCVVYIENGKIFSKKNNREAEELLPETETVFFRKSDTRLRVIFTKDKTTGTNLMIERRAGEDLSWVNNDTKQQK